MGPSGVGTGSKTVPFLRKADLGPVPEGEIRVPVKTKGRDGEPGLLLLLLFVIIDKIN